MAPASYHCRKDGTEFPVSLSISAVRDESGTETARIGVARDISEQVLTEDKIRNINLKLKRTNRTIS
jgi:PAS domain S-box-containing protein